MWQRLFGVKRSEPRNDTEMVEAVRGALEKYEALRLLDLPHITIEAQDGVVTLNGHVATHPHKLLAERLASFVPGITELKNELISDMELRIGIAQRLAQDPLTAPVIFRVHANHGVVHLGADDVDPAVAEYAEKLIKDYPGVVEITATAVGYLVPST